MTDEPKESLLTFPCDFTIKVIGTTSDEFEVAVYGIIHKHVPNLSEGAIQLRPSSNGKYQAITVTVRAESKTQLDSIYQDLTSSPLVIMAL